jgi:CBS domain containing-hemolysin-like protein
MTGTDLAIFGGATLIGIMLSAMFSGLETGLYTINRVRLAVRASRGNRRAVLLRSIVNRPTRMLATLLVANNIANYLSSYGIAALLDGMGVAPGRAIVYNAALLIPLLFVFGEILPKDLFRTHTDHWSYRLAGFLKWTERLLTWSGLVPFVQTVGGAAGRWLGSDEATTRTARQRVSRLIKEGMGAGVLTEDQTTMADRAMALRDRTVRDELIPWSRVARLDIDASAEETRALVRRHVFTRFPVVDRDGTVVGVLSFIECLLDPETPNAELMTEVVPLTPTTSVREALRTLRDRKAPMAIVLENDRPIGIVTLKDLVEPLTGELVEW